MPGLTTGVTAITAGYTHFCAVVRGGVQCWGNNPYGQPGDGTTTSRITPVGVVGLGPGSGVTAIAAGASTTSAVVGSGLQCWGTGSSGQVGNGAELETNRSPVVVQTATGPLTGVTQVAVGDHSACAVAGGALYCWGDNESQQPGGVAGTFCCASHIDQAAMVPGWGSGVAQVVVGFQAACLLTTGGSVYCFGSNGYGELGFDTMDGSTSTPTLVTGLTGTAVSLAMVGGYTCALVGTTEHCWGYNPDGEYGNGSASDRGFTPATTGLSGVTARATGYGSYGNCAIAGGGVWCWGQNSSGQVGIGSTSGTPITLPVRVVGL